MYPSYFTLQACWLRAATRITYLGKPSGIPSLAAFLQRELFRVYHVCCLSLPAVAALVSRCRNVESGGYTL
ncbi:hypothetical protein CLM71_02990 [Serratia sp. MYb239]|nr:hypothetical protein CLM71_02990 [Serratia sp. MYb239]